MFEQIKMLSTVLRNRNCFPALVFMFIVLTKFYSHNLCIGMNFQESRRKFARKCKRGAKWNWMEGGDDWLRAEHENISGRVWAQRNNPRPTLHPHLLPLLHSSISVLLQIVSNYVRIQNTRSTVVLHWLWRRIQFNHTQNPNHPFNQSTHNIFSTLDMQSPYFLEELL